MEREMARFITALLPGLREFFLGVRDALVHVFLHGVRSQHRGFKKDYRVDEDGGI